MDLRRIEDVVKEKGIATPSLGGGHGRDHPIDSGCALQSFLDHIPISSIPGIRPDFEVLELKPNDCVRDAIRWLYDKNVSGAPIVDNVTSDSGEFVDRDIGFIDFYSLVLWSLEGFDKVKTESKSNSHGFLSKLEHISQIGQTKIGELAKSFLWEPFFPVHSDDTLFHVLLLFSKHHRLRVVPVIKSSNSRVIGFITQNAVMQLLLQSSGLEWFDQIAEKSLSEFGFENSSRFVHVYLDQTLADTLHIMWEKRVDGVPVVDRKTGALMGSVRCSDIHLLLEDDNLFNNRKSLSVGEFIKLDVGKNAQSSGPLNNGDEGVLRLKNCSLPRMNTMITNRRSDSLKRAMENMVASRSDRSFFVNESGKLEGVVTPRDIISQFSPPSMDSKIDGGGFFTSALELAGCHVEDGSIIRDS